MPAPSLLRAMPLVAPVAAAGTAVFFAAVLHMYYGHGPSTFAAVGAMLLAATITEAYPVPIESLPAGQVSLAAVFVVGAAVVYGWAEAAIVAFGARTAIEVIQRRPPEQLLYNGPVYALAAAAAGAASWNTEASSSTLVLAFDVLSAAFAFYLVNVVLVTAMIALATARSFGHLLATAAVRTIVPFAIIAVTSTTLTR